MRRLVVCGAMALALAACGNDHTPGDRDGACAVEDGFVPGQVRCNDNTVQVCTAPDNPKRDWPMWVVVENCDVPGAGQFGEGACVNGACVR